MNCAVAYGLVLMLAVGVVSAAEPPLPRPGEEDWARIAAYQDGRLTFNGVAITLEELDEKMCELRISRSPYNFWREVPLKQLPPIGQEAFNRTYMRASEPQCLKRAERRIKGLPEDSTTIVAIMPGPDAPASQNADEEPRRTPEQELWTAVGTDDVAEARRLLSAGLSGDTRDSRGRGLLIAAQSEAMVELLLAHGADPALIPVALLFHAHERRCQSEAIAALAKRSADLNVVDAQGKTALIHCIVHQNVPAVQALLSAGAEFDQQSSWLVDMERERRREPGPRLDMVRVLLEAGVNPNAMDREGYTLLQRAVSIKEPGLVRLLLEHGADVNAGRPHEYVRSALDILYTGRDSVTDRHQAQSEEQQRAVQEITALLFEYGAGNSAERAAWRAGIDPWTLHRSALQSQRLGYLLLWFGPMALPMVLGGLYGLLRWSRGGGLAFIRATVLLLIVVGSVAAVVFSAVSKVGDMGIGPAAAAATIGLTLFSWVLSAFVYAVAARRR